MHESAENHRAGANGATPWVEKYIQSDAGDIEASSSGIFNLTTARGIIYRQRMILIGTVAVALVVGLALTLLTKPIYSANATVQITLGGTQILEQGQDLERAISPIEIGRHMNTQAAVIKSRRLAYQVVDALGLDKRADFLGEASNELKPSGMTDVEWAQKRRETAASQVQQSVSVNVPMDSRVLTISFNSESPKIAALVANALADNYALEETRRGVESNSYAVEYVRKQISDVRAKLQQAELSVNAYAKQNNIIGETNNSNSEEAATGSPTVTVTNLFSVNAAYTQARAKRIAAEQRWRAISALPATQLPEFQQNASAQGLVTERAKAATELAQLKQRYGDNFPRILELRSQLSTMDAQIARVAGDIKNGVENEYRVAMRQEQALAGELNKVSAVTMTEQDSRVRYNLLDRDAGALRTQLGVLLDRYNQLLAASNIRSDMSLKLDGAQVPSRPISPNLLKNLVMAALAGLGIAVALAIVRESFDDRLRTVDDVERKLGYSLLGYTPAIADGDDIADQITDPFSPLMEAYASIRTAIDFACPGPNRVMLVTSSEPSEGKSMTAAVLGRKYAQLGRKTLLIEGDLRKPSLSKIFSTERKEKGLVEVLLGDMELQAALMPSGTDNLDVLPVGKTPVNPVELLSSPVMAEFIERCRSQYSLILIDSAPVMGLADAPLLARLVDGTIFIVEANRAHYGQAKTALRRLRNAGANVVGIVLTKYRAADAGQVYDYHYRYYTYGSDPRK